MAAILGILLLGAIITGMAYLMTSRVGRTQAPTWKRDEAYKERPVDQYITVSLS